MNVLFVCTGNTCRSPMAEGYLKSKKIEGLFVESRGLIAGGQKASENSLLAMLDIGIDISSHISCALTADDIENFDKIICLSPSHQRLIVSQIEENKKVSVLGKGISDPFGQDLSVYKKCRDEIITEIDKLIENGFFNDFSVLLADRDHIPQIAKIEKICFSEPWTTNSITESLINGTKFFVAVSGKIVLGYVGISCILDEGYITNIAVLPKYRKMGVGCALLNKVFKLANELSLSFVSLEVRESNSTAINLYKKMNFKNEGLRKDFYRNPRENAIIMTKRFENNENS